MSTVDLVFPVGGERVPVPHGYPLYAVYFRTTATPFGVIDSCYLNSDVLTKPRKTLNASRRHNTIIGRNMGH